MLELSFHHVKKYMDANLVLKHVDFQIYEGEKVGIVGANGSGKSTILKLIAGIEKLHHFEGSTSLGYDEGWITIPREATVAYLDQIPNYPEHFKVIDVLNLAFADIHTIEQQMRDVEAKMKQLEGDSLDKALKLYGELLQKYEAKGGYDIAEKLGKVCTGLKMDELFLQRPFCLLSGGEKTRVVLGKLLIDNPDILLLDEPTNHLDMDSIEWLESYLKTYKGIVIVVSHDRYFLDNVVTKIIEIEDKESDTYKGNYSAYIKEKEERMLIQFEDYKEQQKQIKAMEKAIKDLRDWAQRADNNKFFQRAASMQKRLDKMTRIEKPVFEKKNMKLQFQATERSGNDTVKIEGLFKSFADKKIFVNANALIQYGERVALIGPNGSGKTTLLKMLLGEELPDAGVVELGANVKLAYLPQNIVFDNEELTLLEWFREGLSILEGKAREYLSKFMFFGGTVFKKVKHLSGGERIRLKLSKLLYFDVNILILDEPTNHLDIDSIETLEEALEQFKGTIFFISHDRYFINKICERVIAIEDHALKSYLGNYDFYKLEQEKQRQKLEQMQQKPVQVEKPQKPRNQQSETKRKEDLRKIEANIERIEQQIQELDAAMLEEGLDYEKLNQMYSTKEQLSKELEILMEQWLEHSSYFSTQINKRLFWKVLG